jgi:DNA repair protein RecO (recombination protein O)
MRTQATRGIVLKRRNFGEADKIVVMFTQKYGRITARVLGARRPLSKLAGHCELFIETNYR